MENCVSLGTKKQAEEFERLVYFYKTKKFNLVKSLSYIQDLYGYLSEGVLREFSRKTLIPLSEIYSVASFYAQFSFSPKGKYPISVCLGTACYVKGSQDVFNKVCEILNIKEGETTTDGLFSIDETRCLGCCGMAPVLMIGKDVFGNVKLNEIESILNSYKEK